MSRRVRVGFGPPATGGVVGGSVVVFVRCVLRLPASHLKKKKRSFDICLRCRSRFSVVWSIFVDFFSVAPINRDPYAKFAAIFLGSANSK